MSKGTPFTTPVKHPKGAMIDMFAEGITSGEW
jgi:hypothetical protein